jgi:hypothetical protein
MDEKYCDCGDPFQIHDSNDPKCSKVRGVVRKVPTGSFPKENREGTLLMVHTRKVANLAHTLSDVMTVLGVLTVIGGIFLALQSSDLDLGNGYGVSTRPYVTLGIALAVTGVLQIMVLRLVFNYIEMQARFREWQLSDKTSGFKPMSI